MSSQGNTSITSGDLVAAITEEVTRRVREQRMVNSAVSYTLHELFSAIGRGLEVDGAVDMRPIG